MTPTPYHKAMAEAILAKSLPAPLEAAIISGNADELATVLASVEKDHSHLDWELLLSSERFASERVVRLEKDLADLLAAAKRVLAAIYIACVPNECDDPDVKALNEVVRRIEKART